MRYLTMIQKEELVINSTDVKHRQCYSESRMNGQGCGHHCAWSQRRQKANGRLNPLAPLRNTNYSDRAQTFPLSISTPSIDQQNAQ